MKTLLLVSFAIILYFSRAEVTGQLRASCPPPAVNIAPCTCQGDGTFECSGLTSAAQLKAIFDQDFSGVDLNTVTISGSSLGRLPDDAFGTQRFNELTFSRTSFSMPLTTSLRPQKNFLRFLRLADSSVADVVNLDALDGGILYGLLMFDSSVNTLKGDPYLPQLYVVDLTGSSLRYLPVLTRARSVHTFVAISTNIYSLAPNMFANFPALTNLILEGNKLVTLVDNWLNVNSDNLTNLYLRGNGLTYIDPGAIAGIRPGTSVKLDGNQLTSLNEQVFRPLLGVAQPYIITVSGNPFNCDCTMAWIFRDPELMNKINGACFISGAGFVPFPSVDVSQFDDC